MEKQIWKVKSPVCISQKVDSNPHAHTPNTQQQNINQTNKIADEVVKTQRYDSTSVSLIQMDSKIKKKK